MVSKSYHCAGIVIKQLFYKGKSGGRKVENPLTELRVKCVFDPWHIRTLVSYTFGNTVKADFNRQIEEKDSVGFLKSAWHGTLIVAVDNPAVVFQDFFEFCIEFFLADGSVVRSVPYHIKVMERQAGLFGELSCKCAFA